MATGKICKITDCKNILKKTDGLICPKHRSRFFRHGDYNISPNYKMLKKGLPQVTNYGYIRIFDGVKRVLQHRLIMEKHLKRPLLPSEKIHHKNGIKTDNRIENLILNTDHSEHMKKYHKYIWRDRKSNPPFTKDKVKDILNRLSSPIHSYNLCFCGNKIRCRNLCCSHYLWAIRHKIH